jgi:hypothetical protein
MVTEKSCVPFWLLHDAGDDPAVGGDRGVSEVAFRKELRPLLSFSIPVL